MSIACSGDCTVGGLVSTGCNSGRLRPGTTVTVIDRPRNHATDVTKSGSTGSVAPRLVRDALGNQTQLFRGNRDFPGLVTRIVHANGWVNGACHAARGLVTKLKKWTFDEYRYDALGRRVWVQSDRDCDEERGAS